MINGTSASGEMLAGRTAFYAFAAPLGRLCAFQRVGA